MVGDCEVTTKVDAVSQQMLEMASESNEQQLVTTFVALSGLVQSCIANFDKSGNVMHMRRTAFDAHPHPRPPTAHPIHIRIGTSLPHPHPHPPAHRSCVLWQELVPKGVRKSGRRNSSSQLRKKSRNLRSLGWRWTSSSSKYIGNMCNILQDEKTTIGHVTKAHAKFKATDFHCVLILFSNAWHRYKRRVLKYNWFFVLICGSPGVHVRQPTVSITFGGCATATKFTSIIDKSKLTPCF